MELGRLIPPMVGTQPLRVENLEECIACHDNSRGGSRRLSTFLHLLHMNRDNFPVAKNNCAVCHLQAGVLRQVSFGVCSACHEDLHHNNQDKYTDAQCQSCHLDYGRGHIVPTSAELH